LDLSLKSRYLYGEAKNIFQSNSGSRSGSGGGGGGGGGGARYKLLGLIVHHGPQVSKGHYTAYVRWTLHDKKGEKKGAAPPERWYLMDDGSIFEVSLKQVLEQQAYVLVYEAV